MQSLSSKPTSLPLMASVAKSTALLRRSSAGKALPAPATPPSLSYRLAGEKRLPVFSGLKLHRSSGLALLSSGKSFRVPCGARRGVVCQAQETANDIPSVTDASWESLVLKSDRPVVVEFWAPWCGPCRMFHPVIGELADEYTGKLECFKLNTDESPSIATQYGVRGVPTIMIFSNGEKKETVIGAVPKTTIAKSVDKFVQNK